MQITRTKSRVIEFGTDVSQNNDSEFIAIEIPMKVVHDMNLGGLLLVLVEGVPAKRHDHGVYGCGTRGREGRC